MINFTGKLEFSGVFKAIEELPQAMHPAILTKAMQRAEQEALDMTKRDAPVWKYKIKRKGYIQMPGTLRKSVQFIIPAKPRTNTVYVGIGLKRNKNKADDPWFQHFVLYGTNREGSKKNTGRTIGNNFLRKSWDKVRTSLPGKIEAEIKELTKNWVVRNNKVIINNT